MPEETPRDTTRISLASGKVPGMVPVVVIGPEGERTVWMSVEDAVALLHRSPGRLWLISSERLEDGQDPIAPGGGGES